MNLTKRRRGRPRRDRPKIDFGTEELQQKRKLLLEKGGIQDPSLAASLLGVLYAHQMISRPLYEAGQFFGELGYRYEPCLGHTFRPRSSILNPKREEEPEKVLSEWQDKRRTQLWRSSLNALKQAGPHPYKVVLHVVFYDQELYLKGPSCSFLEEITPLRQGLKCLDAYFKGEWKDNQGRPYDPALNHRKSTTFRPSSAAHPLHLPL